MVEDKRRKVGGAAIVLVIIGALNIVLGATTLPAGDVFRPVVMIVGTAVLLVGVFYLFRSQKKA